MGYEGNMESISSRPKITLKDKANIISTSQFPKKDSLQIWYKTYQNRLFSTVTKDNYKKDFCIKIKEQKKIIITSLQNGT
jgi:hypothetical protein